MSLSSIIKKVFSISPIWIVPIAALVIAGWIAVEAHLQKGALIEIAFESAHDIVPGQTLIKHKDVTVGEVKSIRLSKGLSQVLVEAEIDREMSKNLSENTRFWVVKPRVSAGGISNLGTLISGVYIVMDPGEAGPYKTDFDGLDRPPLVESDERGTSYLLQSKNLGHIDIGSPIYFRQIRVGEVTGYALSDDYDFVDINVFIRAPHDQLIDTRTRFWNVSGFGFSVGAQGIKANVASLASIINGGIEFENVAGFTGSEKAESGHVFFLHPDKESVLEGRFNIKFFYLMKFSSTVRGLSVGAPVEYKGIKVGEVVDVKLAADEDSNKNLHVFLAIEPQRFDHALAPTREEVDARLGQMVARGLRGTIRSSSLLTGAKYIDLTERRLRNNTGTASIVVSENYTELPTIDDSNDHLMSQVSSILEQLDALPYQKIGQDLSESLASLNTVLNSFAKNNTASKIDSSIESLDKTLLSTIKAVEEVSETFEGLSHTVAPDSELQYELKKMLRSIGEASEALEVLTEELERNPNSLIYGSKKND